MIKARFYNLAFSPPNSSNKFSVSLAKIPVISTKSASKRCAKSSFRISSFFSRTVSANFKRLRVQSSLKTKVKVSSHSKANLLTTFCHLAEEREFLHFLKVVFTMNNAVFLTATKLGFF